MLRPAYNYLLLKRLEKESGVVTETDIEDTHQRYEVLAVPKYQGHYEYGVLVESFYKVGQIVYVQKHAEADSPKELLQRGEALVLISRVMAVEEK